MQRERLAWLPLVGLVVLNASSAFAAPLPPTPTPVGGELWPYLTIGVVVGVGAWKIWKK